MEQRKKIIKGSSFDEQFDTLPKEKQDEYLRRFKNAPESKDSIFTVNSEDSIMNLPEEIRQQIVSQMDPFDMHRLYNASVGPFKNYCDEIGWSLKIRNDFPRLNFVLGQRNVVWSYFSLFFSEMKYTERLSRYWDTYYSFVYGDYNFKYKRSQIYIYYEEGEDNYIVLCMSEKPKYKKSTDKIWEYFRKILPFSDFYEIKKEETDHDNDNDLSLRFNQETTDMFKVFYTLFEMGFKLMDTWLYEDTKNRYFISSCISCKSAESAFVCKSCKSATYCSKECQKKDWENSHFKVCN